MNYIKKSFLLSIIFIITIQILLLLNNKQKTTFRYFIWNIKEVSIGKIISVSFMSGIIISALLNKTIDINKIKPYPMKDDDNPEITEEYDSSFNENKNNDSFEMPPERDLRDSQPTISVNYRVIKNNSENELKDSSKNSNVSAYNDDWINNETDW